MTTPAQPQVPKQPPRAWVIAVLYACLCLIWGSTWVVIKLGLHDLPAFWSAGIRMALAGGVLVAIAPAFARFEGGRSPPAALWFTVGVLHHAGSFGVVYVCSGHLPAGLVAVLWAVFPMLVAILGTLFVQGERVRAAQWLGFVIAFAGVGVLFESDLRKLGGDALWYGALLLLSPLLAAISTLSVKNWGGGYSSALLNRNAMLLAGVLLVATAWLVGEPFPVAWTPKAVFSVLYLTLFGSVFAFGAYFWLIRYVTAWRMSLIAYVTPAISLLLSNLVLGEEVQWTTLAGAAVIVTGVVLATLRRAG